MRAIVGRALLFFLAFAVAAYAVFAYAVFPLGSAVHPDMKADFVAHPVGIYTHVFAAAAALALGPFQFSTRLRERRIRVHRWLGRVYLGMGVLVGGLSGLYISQFAFGGLVAKLGFGMLAVCWLFTGACALLAVRRGEIEAHRRWMVRNFALAFAAVTLRLYIPAAVTAGIDFAIAYPFIAWLCWVPNIIMAEWLNTTQNRSLQPTVLGGR